MKRESVTVQQIARVLQLLHLVFVGCFSFRAQDEISMWEGGMPLAFSLQDTVEEGGSIKQANSESHDAHKSEPLQEKTWFFSLESCVRLLQKKYC